MTLLLMLTLIFLEKNAWKIVERMKDAWLYSLKKCIMKGVILMLVPKLWVGDKSL
jgi:hypothetical protein